MPVDLPAPADGAVRVAFLGDIVGKTGRRAAEAIVPALREAGAACVAANAENASGGNGLSAKEARALLAAGFDVLTTGNHVWRHRDLRPLLDAEPRILRPANLPDGVPGHGAYVFRLPSGRPLLIVNLIGRTFMHTAECPFGAADRAIASAAETLAAELPPGGRFPVLVDFHAEATAEKGALRVHLDGRVSAVLGTHTHVQTSDARVSPAGTGRMTDVGMCGDPDSVIGFQPEPALRRFRLLLPEPYLPSDAGASVEGAVIDLDPGDGRCLAVRAIRVP
jgi:hypothetical protein